MGAKRKKTRTHVPVSKEAAPGSAVPSSFVMRSGKVTRNIMHLVHNVRSVMEPNTATKLKEKNKNKLKDFVSMAGPLGVSHFLIFSKSQSETGGGNTNLRLCKSPKGPTLTFRVQKFTLMKDIAAVQAKPRAPGMEYQHPPLLVLNNFNRPTPEFKLLTLTFQNMFPALNIQKMHITSCRRVVLLNYCEETDTIEFRHYYVNVGTVGVSKSIKRVVQTNVPDLSKFDDISEYILRDANLSESEMEDNGESVVTLPANYVGRNNTASSQRSLKLSEIGPRLTLQLLKIQDGLCNGEVLYHKYIQKTKEEMEHDRKERERKASLKANRKREQEKNVEKKKLDLEEHKKRCVDPKQLQKKKEREEAAKMAAGGEDDASDGEGDDDQVASGDETEDEYSDEGIDNVEEVEEEEISDSEYYRQEVGQEPDEDFYRGSQNKKARYNKK